MNDIMTMALTAFLGGGLGVALISAINERWKFKAQRKASKEDREAEKADRTDEISEAVDKFKESEGKINASFKKRIKDLEDDIAAQSKAMRFILLDRILTLGQSYIDAGEISYDERRRFHMMHDCYHNDLGGNGDADLIVKAVDALPPKA